MSTDTDQSLGAGVVWHTAMESSAVSDTDTDTESEQFTEEELQAFCGNRLYRCDKLTDTKKECNALLFYGQQSANMYSSVTNPLYDFLPEIGNTVFRFSYPDPAESGAHRSL